MTSLFAFVVGALGAWLLGAAISWMMGGIAFGAATFTTNVIQLRVAPTDLWVPLLLAVLIGLFGGLAPALRAASMRPVDALRKA
jgi:ABC-type antimicrobial peptide transport system permease subunit